MDYYKTIAGAFQDAVEAVALSVDALAAPIERAGLLMTACLVSERKILVCGSGVDAALAQLFAGTLLGQGERERPGLPVLSLCGDGVSLAAVARASGSREIFSRPLRALGQEGDMLLCISSDRGDASLLRAVQAARERNMSVVALSNERDAELGALLGTEDVELRVSATCPARVRELQTMVIHCFCELIDQGLFGHYDQE